MDRSTLSGPAASEGGHWQPAEVGWRRHVVLKWLSQPARPDAALLRGRQVLVHCSGEMVTFRAPTVAPTI